MTTGRTCVVIGAGLGGLRTVEELRRAGFDGRLVLVGAEHYPPYDRPPLSKEVLRGTRTAADIRLRDDAFFADNRVELRLGVAATALHPAMSRVVLDDGTRPDYDDLVVATGLRPRRLAADALKGVHVLRSLDDCLALRLTARSARSALLVGAGFVGCEAAASLSELGMSVCMVEPQPVPLNGVLGEHVGGLIARWHRAAGVDLRCGTGVREFLGTGSCTGARLSDGSEVAADVVLVCVGSEPETEWLSGSGVRVENGVLCDENGRASVHGIWAVGDVAAWPAPDGSFRRFEHWTRAGEQARTVARAICGTPDADHAIPYFWSDQHGLRLQVFGHVSAQDDVSVQFDDGRRFLALYTAGGVVTGVAGAGVAGRVTKLRRLIGLPAPQVAEVTA